MRRALILLGVLGIAFAAVLGLGAGGQTQGEPQALGSNSVVRALGRLTAPFAPRLPFPQAPVSVAAGALYRWTIPPSGEPVRILRLTLRDGPLAEIRVCPPNAAAPCGVAAVCAVPDRTRPPAAGACAQGDGFGPSVTVSARKEDGTLWISAPNGPVTLLPE